MNKRAICWFFGSIAVALVSGGGYAYYLLNVPHRDIQNVSVFEEISADNIVKNFLDTPEAANAIYLSENGESKVLIIVGTVSNREKNQNGDEVITLRSSGLAAGVRCTFTSVSNSRAQAVKIGAVTRIKGVIRAGANFDPDLELYEDVIIEKCDIAN